MCNFDIFEVVKPNITNLVFLTRAPKLYTTLMIVVGPMESGTLGLGIYGRFRRIDTYVAIQGQESVKDCLTETVTKGIWAILALSLKYVDFKFNDRFLTRMKLIYVLHYEKRMKLIKKN